MNTQLLSKLSEITAEEQQILAGHGIDRDIYTSSEEFVIDIDKLLRRGKLMKVRKHTRFTPFPRHRHNYIEIIYMCKGSTVHTVNDDCTVELQEGELLFLNPHSYHEIAPAGEADIAVNICVLPEFFTVASPAMDQDSALRDFLISTLCHDAAGVNYIHFQVAGVLPIQNLMENMIWSQVDQGGASHRTDQATLALLISSLLDYTDKTAYHSRSDYENMLMLSVLRYIDEEYRQANFSKLAQRENLSLYYLSRLVKKNTGFTCKQLLQQKRLRVAKQLLCETSMPILDIIYAVGYDNTSYFYRIFKQCYGASPKQYRREIGVKSE